MSLTPTTALREEHGVILDVLESFEARLAALVSMNTETVTQFAAYIDFFRSFTDYCHHRKEETCLFPLLQRWGWPPDSVPIARMLSEHRDGRASVTRLANCIDDGEADAVVTAGMAYVDLLRAHIEKENSVLFELADLLIEDSGALLAAYARVEAQADYIEAARRGRDFAQRVMDVEY